MSGRIEHEYTDEIVCPYCGYKFSESYEYESDSGWADCEECSAEFLYERRINITYTTKRKTQ